MTFALRPLRPTLLIGLAVLAADQISKYLLLYPVGLIEGTKQIELLPIFSLVIVWNHGVSFGLLAVDHPATRWLLIALALVISSFVLWWAKGADRRWPRIAAGLVIGGAAGNIIDRIIHGAVADFFFFHYDEWYFPAFNIADAGITCGAVLLLLDEIVQTRRAAQSKSES